VDGEWRLGGRDAFGCGRAAAMVVMAGSGGGCWRGGWLFRRTGWRPGRVDDELDFLALIRSTMLGGFFDFEDAIDGKAGRSRCRGAVVLRG